MKRRKPPTGSCSPGSSSDSDEDPSSPSYLQHAYTADAAAYAAANNDSPSWSCGYGAETAAAAACSAYDDSSAMHMDMQLHQMFQRELTACTALSADAPACRLPQLQVQQGFMGMQPASCSAVLSPSPDAAGQEFGDFLAAAMQQELQQCLQEQQQAAQGATCSSAQPMGSSAPAQQQTLDFMSGALQSDSALPQQAAADVQPWSDNSNNSGTLPIIDVYSGLMSQPAALHAPSAAAVAAADAEALQRQVRLQQLLARQQQLEHAAAAAARAAESTAAMTGLLGLTAPARMPCMATSAQLPAGAGYQTLSSRASMLPAAGQMSQSSVLYRMPTASSINSAATLSFDAPLMHVGDSPRQQELVVAQRLDELQGQFEKVAAQLGQLKDIFTERLMMRDHSTNASSGTMCLAPGMGMF